VAKPFIDLRAGMSPEAQEMAKEATLILSPQATTQVLKPYFDYVDALEKEVVALRAHKIAAVALLDAADRVLWFDWSDNDHDAVKAIDGLRAAVAAIPSD